MYVFEREFSVFQSDEVFDFQLSTAIGQISDAPALNLEATSGVSEPVFSSYLDWKLALPFQPALTQKESGGDLPGNSTTTATLAGGANFSANMDNASDVDWYRLDVSAGLNYRISHQGPSTMTVVTADGTVVFTATSQFDAGIPQEVVDFVAQTNTTYYVAITASATNSDGLESTFPGTYFVNYVEDEYTANTSTTALLSVGNNVTGEMQGTTDVDWIALNVTVGETYVVTLGGIFQNTSSTDAPFSIVDANGAAITATSFIDENFEGNLEFEASITGTLYVVLDAAVSGDEALGGGFYELRASNQASETPGDTSTQVTLSTAAGNGIGDTLDSPGDSDWFRLNVTDGETVDFFVSYSSQTSVSLNLYSSTGELLASGVDSTTQSSTSLDDFQFDTGGEYYIEVAENGGGVGQYFIQANGTPLDIPGDNTTTASLIPGADPIPGIYDTSNDTDWYRFDAFVGDITEVSVAWMNSSDVGNIAIYDANGTQLTAENTNTLTFEALSTGTYFIEVAGNAQIAIGASYAVSVTGVVDDFSGSSATNGSLTAGVEQTGELNFEGDEDWFAFSLQPNEVGSFTITNEIGAMNVTVVDAAGNLIVNSNEQGFDFDLERNVWTIELFDPSPTTTYYLNVGAPVIPGSQGQPLSVEYDISFTTYVEPSADINTVGVLVANGDAVEARHETITDDDWFRLDITEPDFVTFLLTGMTDDFLSVAAVLSIYDQAGDLVSTLNPRDNTYAFDTAGTYFFSVAYTSNETQPTLQNYQIEANLAADGTPRPEDVGNLIFLAEHAQGQGIPDFSSQPTDHATLANGNIAIVAGLELGFAERNVFIQIVNSDGDIIGSTIELGASEDQAFTPEIVTHDNGFIVSYFTSSTIDGVSVARTNVAYFDNAGQLLSDDFLVEITGEGFGINPNTFDMIALPDGSFAATGVTAASLANGTTEFTLYVFDAGPDGILSNGTATIVGQSTSASFDNPQITVLADGSSLLTFTQNGVVSAFTVPAGQPYAQLAPLTLTRTTNVIPTDVAATADGFVFAGFDAASGNLTLQIFNADGSVRVDRVETPLDRPSFDDETDIIVMDDGSILVSGEQPDPFIGQTDSFLYRYDADGQLLGDAINLGSATFLSRGASLNQVSEDVFSVTYAVDGAISIDFANIASTDRADPLSGNFVSGTSGNDTLIGAGTDDILTGLAGNDVLIGGAGADSLDGGDGIDTASYEGSTGGVIANLSAGTGSFSHAQGDSYTSIENIIGSSFNDYIAGGSGNNTLRGGAGNDTIEGRDGADTLIGGAGADTLNGGANFDTVSYAGAATGILASLFTGVGGGGDAAGDSYISIEALQGSSFNDVLVGRDGASDTLLGGQGSDGLRGNGGNDFLFGQGGDDLLFSGFGADYHNGGSGTDTILFNQAGAGVIVNLTSGTGAIGQAAGDTYVNIENVIGTAFGDLIVGDAGANVLQGRGARDVIQGRDGNDTINGGIGNDVLNGGTGADRFVFADGDGADRLEDFNQSENDMIDLSGHGLTSFAQVQALLLSSGNDVVLNFGGGDAVRLVDIDINDLSASDFILATPPASKLVSADAEDALPIEQDALTVFLTETSDYIAEPNLGEDTPWAILLPDDIPIDWG